MPQIGYKGLTSLEVIGLKSILSRMEETLFSNEEREIVWVDSDHPDFERSTCFILSSNGFIENLDFFIPHRSKIIIISRERENKLKEGSRIYVMGDSSEQEIAHFLRTLLFTDISSEADSTSLSVREKEVLREVASGKTNKEIAESLSISVNTVITHRKNISSKLGIKSVSGLSLYALMNGII